MGKWGIFNLLAFITITTAYADTLQLCNQARMPYLQWSRDTNCQSVTTLMDKQNVIWSSLISSSATLPDRLTIEGVMKGKVFIPKRAEKDFTVSVNERSTITPFSSNLLAGFGYRIFGSEERVSIEDKIDHFSLICKAGNKPAGLLLSPKYYRFVRGIKQRLILQGEAQGQFQFSVVNKGADAPDKGRVLPQNQPAQIILALDQSSPKHDKQITIVCPNTDAILAINSVEIEPTAQLSPRNTLDVSTWIWDFKVWQQDPDGLVSWAIKNKMNKLYIQVEIKANQITYPQQLQQLLKKANQQGVKIVVVEGDPQMIQGQGLQYALTRTATITSFQKALPTDNKFAGIQYDIEPYILEDFAFNPDLVLKKWADAIEQLQQVWGSSVELAVPFWLLSSEGGAEALSQLRPYLSALVIMAYRTDDQLIINASEPLLNWGEQHNVKIVVALENGPIPDVINRVYMKSTTGGELEYIQGTKNDIVLLGRQPIKEGKTLYRFSHEVAVPGSRISYLGDKAKLLAAKQRLEAILVAWPSFSGFALHELK